MKGDESMFDELSIWRILISATIGYLIGSINPAIIISKVFYRKDIRSFDSGNAGTTNMFRVFGTAAGALTMAGDILKGYVSTLIGLAICDRDTMLIAGVSCLLGHCFPIYFGFKGGKAVAAACGMLFAMDWRVGIIVASLWVGSIALTRYVSLGSVLAAITLPITYYIFQPAPLWHVVAWATAALFVIYMHRANVKRLISGTEPKFSVGGKREAS